MNNIVLTISLLSAFLIGFFTAIKAVHLGLRWQIQTKEGKEPKLETPITEIKQSIDNKKQEEMLKYYQEQWQEYVGESR